MLPLRFPYLWLSGGLLVMATILVVALLPAGRGVLAVSATTLLAVLVALATHRGLSKERR